ncbi:MAG: hypothetical protein A2396_03715 [Candidatus Levybacteria bacterium RIFOXYB1_FULL_40_17]|nr:MAG: hypothetical protein A2396_03715 [Candidatus Levybacteria bacterium RIFOXYB1_FULL_40_17]
MRGKTISIELKNRTIKLRKLGYSYSFISEKTKIAKGTLSEWLSKVPYKPNKFVLKRIKESSIKSAMVLRNKKNKAISYAKKISFKELGTITKRDLWMLGIGLYIGEGSKNKTQMVRMVNSDPFVINLTIAWFKYVCGLSIKNFRMAIHTYPDLDQEKILNFWSKSTKIPRSQFRKTYIDIRTNKSLKNKNKSVYGTALLTIYANGQKEYGVFLFRRIMGWIESIEKQFKAGIV